MLVRERVDAGGGIGPHLIFEGEGTGEVGPLPGGERKEAVVTGVGGGKFGGETGDTLPGLVERRGGTVVVSGGGGTLANNEDLGGVVPLDVEIADITCVSFLSS
jgi:hypothetical protein